jgi:hypothetical protein
MPIGPVPDVPPPVVQTDGPGVQGSVVVVTIPSGPIPAAPEHLPGWAWQINGGGQSAVVLHSCGLAAHVPVLLVGGFGTSHVVVLAGHAGTGIAMRSGTQSKSALGQSAAVLQESWQVPATIGVGAGTGGSGLGAGITRGPAPASVAGPDGVWVGGDAVEAQLPPAEQTLPVAAPVPGLATLPPAPPVPSLALGAPMLVAPPAAPIPATVVPGTHRYPEAQSDSVMHSVAAAVRPSQPTNRKDAADIRKMWREDREALNNMT